MRQLGESLYSDCHGLSDIVSKVSLSGGFPYIMSASLPNNRRLISIRRTVGYQRQ
jgi:hypothetical protein